MHESHHQHSQEATMRASADLQVWNNAAFDDGESNDYFPIVGPSCSSNLKPPSLSSYSDPFQTALLDSSTKENLAPGLAELPLPSRTLSEIKPLGSNSLIINSESDHPDCAANQAVSGTTVKKKLRVSFSSNSSFESQDARLKDFTLFPSCEEQNDIDSQIEEIEQEIGRLSTRLEALRLEKAKTNAKAAAEKRGRVVPARFKEPKRNSEFFESLSKIEESFNESSKLKTPQRNRGLSMAPEDIARGTASVGATASRRGISLGPAEIFSATKMKQLRKQQQEMITPSYQSQNRRKSCFWKLQEVDELKLIKERGRCLTHSPKSRKTTASKFQMVSKQAATTVGPAKKSVKKEDGLISSILPKKLFKDGEKSATAINKKPIKGGRIVASRYNQTANGSSKVGDGCDSTAVQGSIRKRSLPDNDKEENKMCDKKRISVARSKSLGGISEQASESRVKKRWEIPNQILLASDITITPVSLTKKLEMVPKIKAVRCGSESPRDSGAAKRVSELGGSRISYFNFGDEDGTDLTNVFVSQDFGRAGGEEVKKDGNESQFSIEDEAGEELTDIYISQDLGYAEEDNKDGKDCLRIRTLRLVAESPRDSGAAKRISELVGRKSYFHQDQEEDKSLFQALDFAEER